MRSYDLEDSENTSTSSVKIKTVAIIGAGLSGIVSAVHLIRSGFAITVFERADGVGGTWEYDPEPDRDPPFPSIRPPVPDWDELERLRVEGLTPEKAASAFAPPGPVYANMKSRGSKEIMRTSLKDWPEGARAPLDHSEVLVYLRDIARIHRVEENVRFRTRVEAISKGEDDNRWLVQSSRLVATPTSYALDREVLEFDAIVVATGRYGAPRVPDVPGLSSWKRRFPSRIIHSKQYRAPTLYGGKTVLIIGAFISALEITNELISNGAKVYESAKATRVDFRDKVNHENAEKVAMVAQFIATDDDPDSAVPSTEAIDDMSPIPGKVVLQDGRVLDDIHHVIISTGYLTTFPFLGPVLEQPSTAFEDADDCVVTTADGRNVFNLHEDIFYIPDPTLAFIGVTHFANTFSLYDFQAQVLASVFVGHVRLPSEAIMKAEQKRRRSRMLPGTLLNSIFLLDDFVIHRLLHWVNKDLVAGGHVPLAGPDHKWWDAFRAERDGARSFLKVLQDNYLDTYGADHNHRDGPR